MGGEWSGWACIGGENGYWEVGDIQWEGGAV